MIKDVEDRPALEMTDKLSKIKEDEQNNTDTIMLLIPARTNTNYWSKYINHANYVLFYDHKLKFLREGEKASDYLPSAVALVVFGEVNKELINVMNRKGWVINIEDQTTTISDFI